MILTNHCQPTANEANTHSLFHKITLAILCRHGHRVRILLFALLLSLPATNYAQLYAGIHGGATLPQGFYADSRMSDNEWMLSEGHQTKAGAGRGWTAGIDISYALPSLPDLEIALSAEYMQSGMSRDVQDYFDITYTHRYGQCEQYEMHLPHYRNIPVFLGLRYKYSLGGIFDLYGEAYAGLNIRSISDWTTAYANGSWTQSDGQDFADYNNIDIRQYNTTTTFAFRLGAGILVKEMVTIGASFNMLGASQLSWNRTQTTRYSVYGQIVENINNTHTDYTDLRPTLVTVQLGFRLPVLNGSRHVQDW